jgi:purine-binding chemotaxis protein CheW
MADPARATASEPAAGGSAGRRFLTFRVRRRGYALPAENVAEVILVPPVARLPRSPKSLMGLANLRGAVIPVVDPGVMLGLGSFNASGTARAIVMAGAARVALVVDAVDALVFLEAARIETRQAELAAEPGELLIGAFQIDVLRAGAPRTGRPRPGALQTDALQTGSPLTGTEHEVTKILDLATMLRTAFGDRATRDNQSRSAIARTGDRTAQKAASNAPLGQRLLISFEVAGQDYALPLDAVREIIPLPAAISVVPGAEAVLLGVTAWRDTLLPLLSLRGLLGFRPSETITGREKAIVTAVNGALVGLVADRSRALIRADAAAIDPAPAMLAARSGGESKITAIFRGDNGRHLISLLAPEQLFREDTMRQLGRQPATAAASSVTRTSGATLRFVVFRLGDEEFGLPISAVDEVARVPEQLTRVPKMPAFLEGVINLRGEVLPVVDQRRRFDMPRFTGTGRRLIVVRAERNRAGLIVDSVSEVLRTEADAIEAPPDLTGESTRLITGVINVRLGERMILLLDPAELLTQAERGVLDQLELSANPAEPDAPWDAPWGAASGVP